MIFEGGRQDVKRIAVIPARGGSKRIPYKNIKPFLGTPIIVYSIRAALESSLFDEVVVSTDDTRIAELAISAGAGVPFYRSLENSGDTATTSDVLFEVLERYRRLNKTFVTAACLYATAPFMTGPRLRDAVARFDDAGCSALCVMVRFPFPPQRGFLITGDRAAPWFPELLPMRSQDLPEVCHDAGQLLILRCADFMETRNVFPPDLLPYIIPETEAQDIDTEDDWAMAELKYGLITARQGDSVKGGAPE